MKRPSEEELMAYADGLLSEEAAARVETFLADNPAERRLVDAMQKQDDLLRRAFEQPMLEAPPEALVRMLSDQTGEVVPFARPNKPAERSASSASRDFGRYAMPMAAAVALVVGAIGGHLATNRTVTPTDPMDVITLGEVEPRTKLANLLETSPTGSTIRVRSSNVVRRLSVVATFKDRMNRPCREFEVLGNDVEHLPLAVGLACRSKTAAWVIEGAARIGAMDMASSKYVPSGLSERDALDGLLTMLGAGSAVDATEERRMIDSGWR